MFKVLLNQRLFDSPRLESISKASWLYREITLPFAPFPGLSIERFGWRAQKIMAVEWSVDRELFRCHLEHEYPDLFKIDGYEYEELRDLMVKDGWMLSAELPATGQDVDPNFNLNLTM